MKRVFSYRAVPINEKEHGAYFEPSTNEPTTYNMYPHSDIPSCRCLFLLHHILPTFFLISTFPILLYVAMLSGKMQNISSFLKENCNCSKYMGFHEVHKSSARELFESLLKLSTNKSLAELYQLSFEEKKNYHR